MEQSIVWSLLLYPVVSGKGVYYQPTLFSVGLYIDSLRIELSASSVGFTFNSKSNHVVYADDRVFLAPSPKALQNLLNICVNFAKKHGLVYNERTTKFMCIKPAGLKNIYMSVMLN